MQMNHPFWYVLNEHGVPVKSNMLDAAKWLCDPNNAEARRVAFDSVGEAHSVSTVFLGLDHDYTMKGPPVLWESALWDPEGVIEIQRCCGTREQAEALHQQMLVKARRYVGQLDGEPVADPGPQADPQ